MKNIKGEVYPKLKLSISGKEGRIRIGNGVAKILGNPEFVCIYISIDNDALMVKSCEQKEFLAIKVTKNDNKTIKDELRVYSLSFVDDLFDKNSWDMNQTYHMAGIYSKKLNAVIFYYKNAVSAVC